ncbi:MAG: MBL fold metallo-hydrolase [Peptostreptococcaceae bacterium]|nr:MBL fold metallo-hydrolase [Peptostreptococcaceae bacterium]
MNIQTLASGSSGNCYKIDDGKTGILLECGIPLSKIKQKLNFNMNIDACLITHEHKDHARAVKDLMKAGIDCYMTTGTAEVLKLSGHRLHRICQSQHFTVGSFEVLSFETIHDAAEPCGFVLHSRETRENLLFVTDSMYVKYQFEARFDYILTECNFVEEILEKNAAEGVIGQSLKSRIRQSHFGLEAVIRFLQSLNLSRCKRIYLTHLSDTNSDAALMKRRVQEATGKEVMIC